MHNQIYQYFLHLDSEDFEQLEVPIPRTAHQFRVAEMSVCLPWRGAAPSIWLSSFRYLRLAEEGIYS
jgi:hypothetical protein